jgi:intracellular proteinase inhibitor BsuPI
MVLAGALGGPKPAGQEARKDILTYKLLVQPGDLRINRMPSGSPKLYKQSFTFTVSNPTRPTFTGHAPTAQLHDIVVCRKTGAAREEVWRWSTDKMFAQVVTPVDINPGKSWETKADWEFRATDVKDGDYVATASFMPSKGTADAMFKIASGQ